MDDIRPITKVLTAAAFVGFFASSSPAFADSFQIGDIFASIGSGQVARYSSAGVLLQTFSGLGAGGVDSDGDGFVDANQYTTGSAFDALGNLYITTFDSGTVDRVTNAAVNVTSTFASLAVNPFLSNYPESIVFDAAGNAYVGAVGVNAGILKYDAAGNGIDTFAVEIEDRGADWIDLAADQTTMYYTSEGGRIMRYDVGTDTQLADFANIGVTTESGGACTPGVPSGTICSTAFALRLLADGGLLVADRFNVKRLDAAGAVVQTYDVAGENTWFSLNLDTNGTSFWSGNFGTGNLYKFNIATGAVEQTLATGAPTDGLAGVSIFGEVLQGGGGYTGAGGGVTVSEPSSLTLLGLGLGLGLALLCAGSRRRAAARHVC